MIFPLDPSFKDVNGYPASVVGNPISFDYATFLSRRSLDLPGEAYEAQIAQAIRGADPDNTPEDLVYSGRLAPRKVDILPASLPYQVDFYLNWSDTTSPETAALPADHHYQLNIGVNGAALSAPLNLSQGTYSSPVALSRLTLSFKGATPLDQDTLNNWLSDGNIASALPCALSVIPVLRVDGFEQAPVTTPAAVDICSKANTLSLSLMLPELSATAPVNAVNYNNIGAANLHALEVYAFQATDTVLAKEAKNLLDTVRGALNYSLSSALHPDDTEGEFLHLVGLKYMRYVSDAAKRVSQLDGGSGDSGNHLGLTSSQMKVEYLFDLPFAVNRTGFLVDMPGVLNRSVDLVTGQPVWKTFLLSGYAGSAFESYIWQENSRLDAVSTVRGLQYANETGVGTVTVKSFNWATVRPQLNVYAGASASDCYNAGTLQYPRCIIDDPNRQGSIQWLVNLGYTVTLPKTLIQYGSFTGPVYEAERQTANASDPLCPNNGYCASYAINNYAGGYTVGKPASYSYDSALTTGYQSGNNTPASANPAGVPLVSLGGGLISRGLSAVSTWFNDPINLVTGNVYHTERDLVIPGRGGLPFVFERSYNSRVPQDGPLGYGWTHSFNHFLKFYGVENNLAKVSWVDGTGSEKFFATATANTANGNINAGAVLSNPAGIYVRFERLNDGSGQYRITEKNGLTYTFENQSNPGAPSAAGYEPVARLLAIQDRNGNALNLAYNTGCGNLLCAVTDGVGRALSFSYAGSHLTQLSDWSG
ncbi:MAG: DUF6531 domain-containing protein, partial [Methylococcaceae bacterium]|nr:DUF6531 domain-containing protein [Methylococcaceae bacterium]